MSELIMKPENSIKFKACDYKTREVNKNKKKGGIKKEIRYVL